MELLRFILAVLAACGLYLAGYAHAVRALTDQRWRDRRSTRRYAQFQGKTISKREWEHGIF